MDSAARARIEETVRALCGQGDWGGAATAIVRGYGAELFGFLMTLHRSDAEANDVYAEVAESIWEGLPRFTWQSSVRTWAYAIARNVSRMHRRTAGRRERRVAIVADTFFTGIVEKVRTETSAFLRTEKRTRLQALRESLPEEDQLLLVLRVGRGFGWSEVARIVGESSAGEPMDAATEAKEAARLRKRFQLVKDRLREMAKSQGLRD